MILMAMQEENRNHRPPDAGLPPHHMIYVVDTPKEGDGEDTTKDKPLNKPPKRRRRCLSKSSQSKNNARKNNTPVDSNGNDDPMDPAMEQDEPGDDEHSPEPTSDDAARG